MHVHVVFPKQIYEYRKDISRNFKNNSTCKYIYMPI